MRAGSVVGDTTEGELCAHPSRGMGFGTGERSGLEIKFGIFGFTLKGAVRE